MSDDITREADISLDLSPDEAVKTAVQSVLDDYPVQEIKGVSVWRYPDRWEVRTVADVGVRSDDA